MTDCYCGERDLCGADSAYFDQTAHSLGACVPMRGSVQDALGNMSRGAEAIVLLRKLEWCGYDHGLEICPECGAFCPRDGGDRHEANCALARLIGKGGA